MGIGSTKHTDGVHGQMRPCTSAIYVATNETDDVDAVYERARDAGADVGSRGGRCHRARR